MNPTYITQPLSQPQGPKWIHLESSGQNISSRIKLLDKTLSKTLKFRAVTLVTTLGITWLLTGNPVTSLSLTAIQQSTNTAVYYFFEKNHKIGLAK